MTKLFGNFCSLVLYRESYCVHKNVRYSKLLQINLQSTLKPRELAKVIKMTSWWAWV